MGMGDDILVVRESVLFKDGKFTGFVPQSEKDLMPVLSRPGSFEFRKRTTELENDPTFLQPIVYVWVVNPNQGLVFGYRREAQKDPGFVEKRYLGKFSGGVGGHIERAKDYGAIRRTPNPILNSMYRELQEEVQFGSNGTTVPEPKVVGYLYVDKTMFDKVHVGVVAIASTLETQVSGREGCMKSGKMMTLDKIGAILADPNDSAENWTIESWPFVKAFLENYNQ